MSLLRTETYPIGGREYTVRVLPSAQARKAFGRVQKMLMVDEEGCVKTGLGVTMMAVMLGQVSDEDVEALVQLFAPNTSVDMGENRVVQLKDPKVQDELWAGGLEDMYAWLDACIDVNFAGVLEKTRGALKVIAGLSAPKAEPK